MKKGEKGFGLVEVVMAVVIVALLGGVIYFYSQANQKKDKTGSAVTTKITSSASPSPAAPLNKTDLSPVASLNSDSVKMTVNNFYGAYFKAVYKSTDSKAMDAAVAQHGTPKFISYYNNEMHPVDRGVAGDVVLCANGTISSAPTVTDVKIGSDKATVRVKVVDGIGATVVVVNNNGLKIDSIVCSS